MSLARSPHNASLGSTAKIKVLSVEQISTRLDDRFLLLGTNSWTILPHHRTLGATMHWSHDPLSGKEKNLFRRLWRGSRPVKPVA